MTTANTDAKARLNDVDVDRLVGTIGAIEENAELANFTFRARTEWRGGARSRTEIRGYHGAGGEHSTHERSFVLHGDEPPVLLGADEAPNAVEAVLHALASCLAVGFVYNAAAEGIEVRSLTFELEGDLDLHGFLGLAHGVRAGYQGVRVAYRVDADAPRAKLEELCAHVQRTSPVLDMLRNPVPVSVDLRGAS